jgi:SSS family solute:Na+ symporter
VLSSKSANTVRRNSAILPAYSFVLGLLALFGFCAIAAGIKPKTSSYAVPDLYLHFFPSWFEGIAFAAIAIGALVPAAVMSIAAANLFTRNLYKEYIKRDATPAQEATVAKIASLFVKVGALLFVIFLPNEYAIDLQLLGGVWILQTLPGVIIALYTRWFHRWALLAGWLAGMVLGTGMAIDNKFKGSTHLLFGISAYEAVWAFILNLIVAVLGTVLLRALHAPEGTDDTVPEDYVEIGEVSGAKPLPGTPEEVPAGS